MRGNEKVDFLVVGTQKGGTTALASFLAEHPEIFIPEANEVHFFDITRQYLDPSTGRARYEAYHELFAESDAQQLWGEATPSYMFFPFVVERILEYNRSVKLLFLLRDPVKRALSQYQMQRSRGWERWPFAVAAALELFRVYVLSRDLDDPRDPIRIHTYLSRGFYSKQIERFLRVFPRENCLFVKSEELLAEHNATMKKIFSFLGVDPRVEIVPRRVFRSTGGEINVTLARVLRLVYRPDRRRVERLTGLDCSDWR